VIPSVRDDYDGGELSEQNLAPTWLEQFDRWFAEAEGAGLREPNAMQIATVDEDGLPDIRTVLARGVDASGIVFYTNYDSAKARQLATNPAIAGVFTWVSLARQVRFRGTAMRVPDVETAAYFASRPRGSQLGAWASPQSRVIRDRAELDRLLDAVVARFGDAQVPPPPFWGGYRITVSEVEFWQGRESRLHDRLRYREQSGRWITERLAP
jgi:pyridoxamine 5'-phosphate oxidase